MRCSQCKNYVPVNYSKCPNCGSKSFVEEKPKEALFVNNKDSKEEDRKADKLSEIRAEKNVDSEHQRSTNLTEATDSLKRCPYCAEQIQINAIVCRFCRIDLRNGKPFGIATANKNGVDEFLKYGCAVLLTLIIIAFISFLLLLRGCTSNFNVVS